MTEAQDRLLSDVHGYSELFLEHRCTVVEATGAGVKALEEEAATRRDIRRKLRGMPCARKGHPAGGRNMQQVMSN